MSKLERLPVAKTKDGWFWREYRMPDGTLIERHSLFKVWKDETRSFLFNFLLRVTVPIGRYFMRHCGGYCPHCGKASTIKEWLR